eukprot:scaffold387267_cov36-Prasinocladus_malaysianus.AAC.1
MPGTGAQADIWVCFLACAWKKLQHACDCWAGSVAPTWSSAMVDSSLVRSATSCGIAAPSCHL